MLSSLRRWRSYWSLVAVFLILLHLEEIFLKRLPIEPFLPEISHRYSSLNFKYSILSNGLSNPNSEFYETQALMNSSPSLLGSFQINHRIVAENFAHQLYASRANGQVVNFLVKNEYTTEHNQVTHVYLKQTLAGHEIINADMNINVAKSGDILSYGSTFTRITEDISILESRIRLTASEAFQSFWTFMVASIPNDKLREDLLTSFENDVKYLSHNKETNTVRFSTRFTQSPVDGKLQLIQVAEGNHPLLFCWVFEVDMLDNWFLTFVSAQDGRILGMSDWVSEFFPSLNAHNLLLKKRRVYTSSYLAFPMGINDPLEGPPKICYGPYSWKASPHGWHHPFPGSSISNTSYVVTTVGNNVIAQENHNLLTDWQFHHRPNSPTEDRQFHFLFDQNKDPRCSVNASITNLFYWNNMIHDLFYEYGFNESAGNFQQENFDRGGESGDALIAHAQDGSGTNNANFATPPDGRSGRMRMFLWTQTDPWRDGDFENAIIVHEATHGLSTRLTGGPANSNCLAYGEAGGLGEGWGDFIALILRQRPSHHNLMNFEIGSYANGFGIRTYPYSSSLETNPLTYGYIRKQGFEGVHAKGEVWAAILFEAYWNVLDIYPFTSDWLTGVGGNKMILQDCIDGMKLQPCTPSFIDARDAILLADKINYEGKLLCALWKGFSKRGLGVLARRGGYDDFSIPVECPL